MGLFDKLLGSALKEGIKKAADAASEKIGSALEKNGIDLDSVKEAFSEAKKKEDGAPAPAAVPAAEEEEAVSGYTAPVLIRPRREQVVRDMTAVGSSVEDTGSAEYFADVISRNFPGYEVKTGRPLADVTAELPPLSSMLDVVMYRNGAPVAAVLLVRKNSYKRAAHIFTMNACERAGVPALRFMKEFSNEPSYIVGRIRGVL